MTTNTISQKNKIKKKRKELTTGAQRVLFCL